MIHPCNVVEPSLVKPSTLRPHVERLLKENSEQDGSCQEMILKVRDYSSVMAVTLCNDVRSEKKDK